MQDDAVIGAVVVEIGAVAVVVFVVVAVRVAVVGLAVISPLQLHILPVCPTEHPHT